MNERILILANKAYGVDASKPFHFSTLLPLELFAGFVVKECIDWVDTNVGMMDEDAKRDLLKHFGIDDE